MAAMEKAVAHNAAKGLQADMPGIHLKVRNEITIAFCTCQLLWVQSLQRRHEVLILFKSRTESQLRAKPQACKGVTKKSMLTAFLILGWQHCVVPDEEKDEAQEAYGGVLCTTELENGPNLLSLLRKQAVRHAHTRRTTNGGQ